MTRDAPAEMLNWPTDDIAAYMNIWWLRRALTVVVYPGQSELLAVSCVRDWANEILGSMHAAYSLDAQDAQNVLCEFEKYMRVASGGKYNRKL